MAISRASSSCHMVFLPRRTKPPVIIKPGLHSFSLYTGICKKKALLVISGKLFPCLWRQKETRGRAPRVSKGSKDSIFRFLEGYAADTNIDGDHLQAAGILHTGDDGLLDLLGDLRDDTAIADLDGDIDGNIIRLPENGDALGQLFLRPRICSLMVPPDRPVTPSTSRAAAPAIISRTSSEI